MTTSPIGTRTTGVTGYAATAWSCASTDSSPLGECSMSTSSQSSPEPAQISATSGLPEQTHMPASGRRCRREGVAERRCQTKRHVIVPRSR